jgi:hypothetical protein
VKPQQDQIWLLLKTIMESPMATPVFLQDLTEEEAQYVQGGATNPSPQRTDIGIGGVEIPITGSPANGFFSRLFTTLLGTNTVNLTPNGFFRLVFKNPNGTPAQPF